MSTNKVVEYEKCNYYHRYGSDEETRLLIRTRIKYHEYFTGNNGNANKGWKKVVEELATYNVVRANINKFKRKWSAELQDFKKLLEPSAFTSGVGTGDGQETAVDNEVFEMLFEYHKGKHTVQPPALLDTSIGSHRVTDPKVTTGQSNYLWIDDEDNYDENTLSYEYIDGAVEEVCSLFVTAPAKSSPRAVRMVQKAVPALKVVEPKNVEGGAGSAKKLDFDINEDVDDFRVEVKASSSKRCSDFYTPENKNKKKAVAKHDNEKDWLKNYLYQSRDDKKQEFTALLDVVKQCVQK